MTKITNVLWSLLAVNIQAVQISEGILIFPLMLIKQKMKFNKLHYQWQFYNKKAKGIKQLYIPG